MPSYAIPYHYTDAAAADFLEDHAGDAGLRRYLDTLTPPWGVIVQPAEWAVGDILVWLDYSGRIHVVDVTNLPIVDGIVQARYQTPTAAAINEMIDSVSQLSLERFDDFQGAIQTLAIVGAVGVALVALKR